MSIITPEFKKLFEKYPMFSQAKKINPMVITKIYTNNRVWLILEYSESSNTAFGYLKDGDEDGKVGYLYIPDGEKVYEYKRDIYFKPKPLQKIIKMSGKIVSDLLNR